MENLTFSSRAKVARRPGLPRFTQGGRTCALKLGGRFDTLLRHFLIEEPVPTASNFLDCLYTHVVVNQQTLAQVRLEHPVAVLATGDGVTVHAAGRREDGIYTVLGEATRMDIDGYCRELPQIERGAIRVEPGGDDLVVVVRDDRPAFHRHHLLSWWYIQPVDNQKHLGEAVFRPHSSHPGAFSASLPDALVHRVFAVICRADVDQLLTH